MKNALDIQAVNQMKSADKLAVSIDLVRDTLGRMDSAQKRAAIESLQRLIDAERFDLAVEYGRDGIECRECGSSRVVKRGKTSSGNQRYLCRDCGMSFVLSSGGVFAKSKLSKEVWQRYVECFVDMLPLRECARRCGVSLKTSWFMRHRILEALRKHVPAFQVRNGCGAQIDECFFRENFKGNHGNSDFSMPRRPRRRGRQDCKRGISNDLICVMSGVNDAGDTFLEVACRGRLDSKSAENVLRNKIESGSIIATDKHGSYASAMAELGVSRHYAYDSKKEHGGINAVNSLHSRVKAFFSVFNGVSSKWLSLYLAWFAWNESFKKCSASESAEIAVRQLSSETYDTTWRKCKDAAYPFFDYWKNAA